MGLFVAALLIVQSQSAAPTPAPTPLAVTIPPIVPTTEVFRTSATIDFTLPLLDGGAVSLSDYRGQPLILNFWATWCTPCERELPTIARYLQDEDALPVLAINIGETAEQVAPWLEARGLLGAIPVLLDTETQVQGRYGVLGLPTTYGLDVEGVVRQQKLGEATLNDLRALAASLE
jgi:thiol-disulfide isomerase/thioredoxin